MQIRSLHLFFAVLFCFFSFFPVNALANISETNPKLSFWDSPKKGTNQFNQEPTEAWFAAAAEANIEWVRITFSKWESESRDFLAGSLDNYQSLNPDDLKTLKQSIKWADKHDLKVVITPLGLPGSRWTQNNNGVKDQRLWEEKKWWEQSARYWRDIAAELKGHKNIVAYNIINEPTPEMGTGLPEHGDPIRYPLWYQEHKDTSRDLPAFYNYVIRAIREVDNTTPVMVDSGWYAQAQAFTYWPKLDDNKVLYAFHMYEPFDYTSRHNFQKIQDGKAGYTYPGQTPYAGDFQHWNRTTLNEWLMPMFRWVNKRQIPCNRIVAAEFGAFRMNPGADKYIDDLIDIFNEKDIHWAFYSYREDEWDGYDYEMGTEKLGWKYWDAVEKGENPERPWDKDNDLWQVIEKALTPSETSAS